MAGTRDQVDIERDIELTREQLAESIGELTVRLDPRRGMRTAAMVTGAVVAVAVALVVWRRW
jgi:ABC-type Fe2+-enterobactin transport system substrate-binding protein